MWLFDYDRTFTCHRAKGSLGSDVAAQIVLLKFYLLLSLCTFTLIRVMHRLILVILGSFLFKLGVREGVLAFRFTFICGGPFGNVFREMVFSQMFWLWCSIDMPREFTSEVVKLPDSRKIKI